MTETCNREPDTHTHRRSAQRISQNRDLASLVQLYYCLGQYAPGGYVVPDPLIRWQLQSERFLLYKSCTLLMYTLKDAAPHIVWLREIIFNSVAVRSSSIAQQPRILKGQSLMNYSTINTSMSLGRPHYIMSQCLGRCYSETSCLCLFSKFV